MKILRRILNKFRRPIVEKRVVTANIATFDKNSILVGKIALVTGGGSGFGYAITKRFVSAGAKVIIAGRNEEKLKKVQDEFGKNTVRYIVWDICNVTKACKMYATACSFWGDIDIVVNNAGVWQFTNWNTLTESQWDNIVDTNLKGLFFMCQAESLYMSKHSEKIHKIINITSIEGIRGGYTPYFASKWGANGITKGMAKELTSKNIIVNAIAPGMAITDINPNLPKDGNLNLDNLNGRFVTVEEVAELALYLSSDATNCIVGQVIAIDGGMSLN